MLLDTALTQSIHPYLWQLSQKSSQPFELNIIAWVKAQHITQRIYSTKNSPNLLVTGEIRIQIEHDKIPDHFLLSAEAIINNLALSAGYNGFILEGRFKPEGNNYFFKSLGFKNKYNKLDWQKLPTIPKL